MGNRSSRQELKDSDIQLEEMKQNPVLAPLVEGHQTLPEMINEQERKIDLEAMSVDQLAEILYKSASLISQKLQERKEDPGYLLASKLADLTKGNAEATLDALKLVGTQVGVKKSLLRDASIENPRSCYRLARAVGSAISYLVSVVKSQITFDNAFNTYTIYRFGLSPYLIRGSVSRSGISPIGIAMGVAAVGISGRFLYIHPEIIQILKKFRNAANSEDFLKDIDLFVVTNALYQAVTDEVALLLQRGLQFDSFKSDVAMIKPFLSTSVDYIGWSAEIIELAIHGNTTEISHAFFNYLQNQTQFINWLIDQVSEKYEFAKKTVKEASEQAVKIVSKGYEKVHKGIEHIGQTISGLSNKQTRAKTIEYVKGKVQSVWDWFSGKKEDAIQMVEEAVEERLVIPTKLALQAEEATRSGTPSVVGDILLGPGDFQALGGDVSQQALGFSGRKNR